jgi:hypothetical protein
MHSIMCRRAKAPSEPAFSLRISLPANSPPRAVRVGNLWITSVVQVSLKS